MTNQLDGTTPRTPDAIVAAARADKELMRQLEDSLAAEARGEKPVPFHQILEEERRRPRA